MKFFNGLLLVVTVGLFLWIPIVLPWSRMDNHESVTWLLVIAALFAMAAMAWTEKTKGK